MATVKKTLEEAMVYFHININCVDPLGRTALHIAIENENLEMIEVQSSLSLILWPVCSRTRGSALLLVLSPFFGRVSTDFYILLYE